jgi:multidrug efflux pump subunit AcrA (membrane-fusion protein)
MQRVAIVVVGVATLSLGFLGCSGSSSGAGGTLVTVEAQKPAVGPISQKITADAVLSPVSEAVISPKVTSPVRKFYVRRGSHVRVGQLLATLQNQDLSAAALDSEGQYEAEQAVYDSQTKAQFPEDYQKALLDVKQAKAQVTLNEKIVVSRQKLFSQGAIAGRELDTARAALVQANAAYDTALNHLRGMQSVSREESIKQAQGQLKSAKGKYLSAKAQLSFTDIRSPIRGIVTDRPLYAGEMANAGAPLITVMDTSALIAKVHLAEMVAQRLKLGDKAELEIPGITARVPAEVSLISPALDPGSTTIEVWLKVQNPRGQYKAGTPIHALIVGNTATNAMQVPISALLTGEDGSKSVMVVGPDSSAQKKPVTVGINDGKNVQITSGLKADEMVITSGAYGLDNGTKVRVGKPDDSGAVGGEGS